MYLVPSKYLEIVEKERNAFVYHRLLGNGAVFSLPLCRQLKDKCGTSFGQQTVPHVESWIKKGFLVLSPEQDEDRISQRKTEYLTRSLSGHRVRLLVLNTTTACNLKCRYCYVNTVQHIANVAYSSMGWEVAATAIQKFLRLVVKRDTNEVTIRFFGGEPMLNWKLIERILPFASKEAEHLNLKVNFVMVTNGTILTDEQARLLAEYQVTMNVSIDGADKGHDVMRMDLQGKPTSAVIWRNMEKLVRAGCPNEVSAVVHRLNIDHLRQLIDKLANIGVDCLDLNYTCFDRGLEFLNLDPNKKAEGFIEAWLHGQKRNVKIGGKWIRIFERLSEGVLNYCGRMGSELKILPSGDVWPCSGIWKSMGRYDDLEGVLRSELYETICRRMVGNIRGCEECSIEGMCAGGCAGNAEYYFGDLFEAERSECDFRRIVTRRMIELMLEERESREE